MAIRVIDDTKLQNIAVAIQSKDNGGQMTVDEMAGRIDNIPSGSDFDMTVTDNQVKMVIEVDDYDLSFWTRFGISGGGTVTVDWGDGTVDEYTSTTNQPLDYALPKKHNYEKTGRYLVTETVTNGTLTIGSTIASTLSEGPLKNTANYDPLMARYNLKLKELAIGDDIIILHGLRYIPFVKIHTDIPQLCIYTGVDIANIKNGTETIIEYGYDHFSANRVIIPASVKTIQARAFSFSIVEIYDFTNFQLDENGELPITITNTMAFYGISASSVLLFATQEIAEVAKTVTNLSQLASQIKYVGEV